MDNKEVVIRAMTELFFNRDATHIDRYWGSPYLQHNPQIPDGSEKDGRVGHEPGTRLQV